MSVSRRLRVLILALLSVAVVLTAEAMAGPFGGPCEGDAPHCGPGGPPPEVFLEEHSRRLGLDDATRTSIRAIVDASRGEGERLRTEIGEAHRELRRLLSATDVEEAVVMRQAETIGALELEERKNRLRAMLRIRALLTPEQREKLLGIRDEMRKRQHERVAEACAADIDSLCGKDVGHDEMRECLFRRRGELSERCRSAMSTRMFGHGPSR